MTIIVDIRPEVQAELARQAASCGSAIEDYAAALIEEAICPPAGTPIDAVDRKREERNSLVEICAMVRGLTEDIDFSRNPSADRPVEL